MGLFSSEYKTSVGATTVSLLGEQPDFLKSAVTRALYQNAPLGDVLIEHSVNGLAGKFRSAFNYAKDHYSRGLPRATYEVIAADKAAVKAHLEERENASVRLRTVELEYNNPLAHVYHWLATEHGYEPYTRTFSIPEAMGIRMDTDFTEFVVSNSVATQAEVDTIVNQAPLDSTEESTVLIDGVGVTQIIDITYDIQHTVSYLPTQSRTRRILSEDEDADVFTITVHGEQIITVHRVIAAFASGTRTVSHVIDGVKKVISISTLPVLEYTDTQIHTETNVHSDVYTHAPTFPKNQLYYFIVYGVVTPTGVVGKYDLFPALLGSMPYGFPMVRTANDEAYFPVVILREDNIDKFATSQQDTDDYITSSRLLNRLGFDVLDIVESINTNESIDDIDHAYLMFGVNLRTENEGCIRYLCDLFYKLAAKEITPTQTGTFDDSFDLSQEDLFVHYNDDSTSLYDAQNLYNAQQRRYLYMSEGGLNAAISWRKIEVQQYQGSIGNSGYVKKTLSEVNGEGVLRLDWQIDNDTYRTIVIYDLEHEHRVYEDHVVRTTIGDILKPKEDVENDNFVIPLNKTLFDGLPLLVRNEFVNDAVHLVIYSIETVKLKWYQTGWFKALITIAAIVIFVTSGIPQEFMLAIAAGVQATVVFILTYALNMFVITALFELVVDLVGIELSIVLAAIVTALGVAEAFDITSFEALNAKLLLEVSTNLTKAIQNETLEQMVGLENERTAFYDELRDRQKELDEVKKGLTVQGVIDPFELVHLVPIIDFNESPSNFFNRTIHSGNIGIHGYKAVTNFVEIQLRLPEPNTPI